MNMLLFVPAGTKRSAFNVVLRDYGPPLGGSVVCGTYVPPAIQPVR
jgi:hypothetical protein